ncbi:hypothetical protein C8J57DRAFT_1306954 [Mycena rebaudengoi]|nr:hypothetical protein C8J57DRAFT_1306954 [Mycena rebaudengoi]
MWLPCVSDSRKTFTMHTSLKGVFVVLVLVAKSDAWTGGASAPAGLSPCASGCVAAAASQSSCRIPSNLPCICTDTDFEAKITSCLDGECHASEIGAALNLLGSQCVAVSIPVAKPISTRPIPKNSLTAAKSLSSSSSVAATIVSSPTRSDAVLSLTSAADTSPSPSAITSSVPPTIVASLTTNEAVLPKNSADGIFPAASAAKMNGIDARICGFGSTVLAAVLAFGMDEM